MKSYKKAASAFMAAAMAATMLAGCGSKTADTQTTAQETLPQSASGEFSYPISSDEVLTYWCELNQNVSANYSNLGETPFARELMKETGVTIDFQHPPANQGKEQFSLLLADGSLPDLMEYAWMNYPGGPEKAIQDGNIMALNEVFEKYCPNVMKYLEENPDVDKMIKTDDGHYYVFPFVRGDEALCHTIGPMLREDWLEELGLEVPTTIDEWHTVLTAFKEKKGPLHRLHGNIPWRP